MSGRKPLQARPVVRNAGVLGVESMGENREEAGSPLGYRHSENAWSTFEEKKGKARRSRIKIRKN